MPRLGLWFALLLMAGFLASPWLSMSGAANTAPGDRMLDGISIVR